MIMLEKVEELIPPFVGFHLKNLYLSFNLVQDTIEKSNVFHHLSNS
jgi:hypothetical protein